MKNLLSFAQPHVIQNQTYFLWNRSLKNVCLFFVHALKVMGIQYIIIIIIYNLYTTHTLFIGHDMTKFAQSFIT